MVTKTTNSSSSSSRSRYGDPVIENGGGPMRDDIVRRKGDDPMYWKNSEFSAERTPKNYDARKERDPRYYPNSFN
jgi:hypothetical protein